ncbi:MAG: hypothetical protein PVI71_05945 [Desulfobacterales bacterium]|jgi:hypothetical protein
MAKKISTAFKRLTIIGVSLLGFPVILNWPARAETPHQANSVWKQRNPYHVIVAQNNTQTATNDRDASSESEESESKTDEKNASSGDKKKPLKDFQPSEKIEAEQAVDFPYDI